jgi:hypothetical protein
MWRFNALRQVAVDVYNWLLPLAAINILWFLLSLTIVLFPPATAALYEIAYLAKKGHGPGVQAFLEAIRRWLLKSWLWAIVSLLLLFVGVLALWFYSSLQHPIGSPLFIVVSALLLFGAAVQFYVWPFLMAQEKAYLRQAVRNAAFTVLADPLLAFIYVSISLALVIVSVLVVAPMALLTPVMVAFLGMYSLLDWLEHHRLIPKREP